MYGMGNLLRNIRHLPLAALIVAIGLYGLALGTFAAPGDVGETITIDVSTPNSGQSGRGYALENIGDFNSDGVEDIAVGSITDNALYIHYMNSDGSIASTVTIDESTTNGPVSLDVGQNDFYGASVENIGDLNNDGVDELAVGMTQDNNATNNGRGAVQLHFMNTDGTIDSTTFINEFSVNGPSLHGTQNNSGYGSAIAALGDLDGDTVEDFAVSAQADDSAREGAWFIHFMNTDGSIKSTVKIDEDTTNGTGPLGTFAYYGNGLANIGDLNNDGVIDIAVGASDGFATSGGQVFIHFMNTDGTIDSTATIDSGTTNGPVLSNGDFFGSSIQALGDLDGDTVEDIAIGAPGDDGGGSNRGAAHAVFLNSDGSVKSTVELNESTINGAGTLSDNDNYGHDIDLLTDFDGDGTQDLIIGAPGGSKWFLHASAPLATPITNCTELSDIRNDLNASYRLANDIDCSGFGSFSPIGSFATQFLGSLDGAGYTISNVTVVSGGTITGLFGYAGAGSSLSNFIVRDSSVAGGDNTGMVVGYSQATVSRVGGIDNTITATGGSINNTGGLIAYNIGSGTITESFTRGGSVTSTGNQVGGLIGNSNSGNTITDSYSVGMTLTGNQIISGLTGAGSGGTTNTYAANIIVGASQLFGHSNTLPTVSNGYYDADVDGISDSGNGTARTTVQMRQEATFSGFDFTNTWEIVEGASYPCLQWDGQCAGTFIAGTAFTDQGVTPLDGSVTNKMVRLLINGVDSTLASAITTSGGTYTIGPLPAMSPGDVLTLYLDDATENGVLVSRFNSGGITNADIYVDFLRIDHEDTGPLTNANLAVADNADPGTAGDDISSIYTVSTSLVTADNVELIIASGATFTPGGSLDLGGTLDIRGTIDIEANSVNIAGNLENFGTIDELAGSVITMDGTADQTYRQFGVLLSDLIITNTTGKVIVTNTLVDVNDLTINDGATLSLEGIGMTVAGTFTHGTTGNASARLEAEGTELFSATLDTDSGTVALVGDGNGSTAFRDVSALFGNEFYRLEINDQSTTSFDQMTITANTTVNENFVAQDGFLLTNSFDFDVNGDIVIGADGIVNANSSNLNLAGDYSNAGAFLNSGGVTTLDGCNQTIGTSAAVTTFDDFVKTESTNDATDCTLTFDNNSGAGVFNITGTLTLDGLDDDDRLNIVSATPGTEVDLRFSSAASASAIGDFLDISDNHLSNFSLGSVTFPINPANSVSSGANTQNWFGVDVEFSGASSASTDESTLDNFAQLLVNGTLTDPRTISVDITGGTAAALGEDYTATDPTTLTIPAGVYDGTTATAVAITGFVLNGDDYDEANETITLALIDIDDDVALADVDGGGTQSTYTYTITDDDTAGVAVSESSGSTSVEENGLTDTFDVVLDSQPTNLGYAVVVDVTPDAQLDLGSGAGVAIQLTFSAVAWNTAQTVTVTANDDTTDEGTHSGTVTIAVNTAGTTDPDYDLVSGISPVVATIIDDDTDTDGDLVPDRLDDDDDGDGVDDSLENLAPGGDGNGDGTPDRIQSNVASNANPATGAHATIQLTGTCVVVNGFSVVSESDLSQLDPDADYPVGLNDFLISCPSAGDSTSVTLLYDQVYDTSSWAFKKFDDIGNVYSDISSLVTFGTQDVNGTQVTTATYTVTDGGITDVDGSANTFIDDPAGPAVLVATSGSGALASTGQGIVFTVLAALTLIATSIALRARNAPHAD